MSPRMDLRRSPKAGALTAHTRRVPRRAFTVRVARAWPSTSSAMMSSGFEVSTTRSSTGSISSMEEILELLMRMYGSSKTVWRKSWSVMKFGEMKPLSNCMPSVTSSTVSRLEPSSTEMTPSTPTASMALAISSPISGSCAETAATWAICS